MSDEKTLSDPITLEKPVIRGEQRIETVRLRKPDAGELRGISLVELGQMEVTALHKVIPRITMPPLLEHEVATLDPADLMELGVEIGSFLLKKARLEAFRAS